jgi:hypothetical protein
MSAFAGGSRRCKGVEIFEEVINMRAGNKPRKLKSNLGTKRGLIGQFSHVLNNEFQKTKLEFLGFRPPYKAPSSTFYN